ncbi:MAG: hypothetical protein ACOY82_12370 [Pseudomonadota bacterium]
MLDQELEVSFRAKRSAYVVDPLLALCSPYGAQLVSRLSALADLTVTRTFWQAIDASDYYRRDPLGFWPSAMRETLPASTADDFNQALTLWEDERTRTDLSRCRLHWVIDNVSESLFPDGTRADLIERYEALHQALTSRCDPNDDATESAAFYGTIDSLALAAALGNACVLTLAPDLPQACLRTVCEHVGLTLEEPPESSQELVALEQRRVRELIVTAGASSLMWGGLRIAVIHPLLYGDLMLRIDATELESAERMVLDRVALDRRFDYAEPPPAVVGGDPWRAARHFWHVI